MRGTLTRQRVAALGQPVGERVRRVDAHLNAVRLTITRVGVTPDTLAWLERVWRKQETVAGLTLAENDYTALALELAVREVPAWQEISSHESLV